MNAADVEPMKPIPESALSELKALYQSLSDELEPFRRHCDSRGICCNFAVVGHMLYVTGLEAAYMNSAGRRADTKQAHAGLCPFLDGKLCGLRDHRALGCRLYYCDSTYKEDRNALYERYLRQVRDIEVRHGMDHSYQPVTELDFEEIAVRQGAR